PRQYRGVLQTRMHEGPKVDAPVTGADGEQQAVLVDVVELAESPEGVVASLVRLGRVDEVYGGLAYSLYFIYGGGLFIPWHPRKSDKRCSLWASPRSPQPADKPSGQARSGGSGARLRRRAGCGPACPWLPLRSRPTVSSAGRAWSRPCRAWNRRRPGARPPTRRGARWHVRFSPACRIA